MRTEAKINMDGRRLTKVYNTWATQLHESGTFDEQTIMSRTSHRSNAARTYTEETNQNADES